VLLTYPAGLVSENWSHQSQAPPRAKLSAHRVELTQIKGGDPKVAEKKFEGKQSII
jgi:hypothetical protein